MKIGECVTQCINARSLFVIAALLVIGAVSLAAPSAFRFEVGSPRSQDDARKREAREKQERLKEEKEMSADEHAERRRVEIEHWVKVESELTRVIKVSMEQALQIAGSQQAGMPVECRLTRERDDVVYNIVVFTGTDTDTPLTRLQVSARDGKVVALEKIR